MNNWATAYIFGLVLVISVVVGIIHLVLANPTTCTITGC